MATQKMPQKIEIRLQPKQMQLLMEVRKGTRYPLFGGAKGGGKSYGSRMIMLSCLLDNPGTTGLLLRRTYKQLAGNHIRPILQAFPFMRDWYKKADNVIDIEPVGSTLVFGHCEHEEDVLNYQGIEYDFIAVEEVTQFTEYQWQMLASHSNRSTKEGIKPVMWATGNPGGIGHGWVKRLWIDREFRKGEKEANYVFIPSKVWDNQELIKRDPEYVEVLQSIEDQELRRAYLDGDWDIYPGQFFVQYRRDQVVVPSFEIPGSWPLYGSLDFGDATPSAFELLTVDIDGCVYHVSEYYHKDRTVSQHGEGILEVIKGCPHTGGRMPSIIYCDPHIWDRRRMDEQSAHSVAEKLQAMGLPVRRANNDRVNGWRMCKDALVHGKFKVFDGWGDQWLRTVPAVPRDDDNPENIDTQSEDHMADAWRYGMVHIYRPHRRKVGVATNDFSGSTVVRELKEQLKPSYVSVYAKGRG